MNVALVVSMFADLFVTVFNFLLIVRVIMSYVAKPGNRFYGGLVNLTEPLLGPVRGLLPTLSGVDLAPLAVFLLLQVVDYFVHVLLGV